MKSRLSILSDSEIEAIHRSSIRILERVGALVRSPRALKLLVDAGAEVDPARKLVKVPSGLVQECLRKHTGSFTLCGRVRKNDLPIIDGRMYTHPTGGCLNVLDVKAARARTGTTRDLQDLTRVLDALENIHQSGMLIHVGDAAPQVRDIHTVAQVLRNSTKNCGLTAYGVRNLEYIVRLAAAVVGGIEELRKMPLIRCGISPTSPLELSEDVADQLVTSATYGLPVDILPCPLAGGTSPATLAGTLVQQNAEFLISHVIVQLANPANPVFYAARPFCMDMRTGVSAIGAVESGMMSAAAVQLARYYNIPSDVYGLGTNSKILDEQTAFEKAMVGLLPALAGANFLSGAGGIDSGVTYSLEQLVIDNEIFHLIFRAVRGIDVNSDTLAADLVEKIGPGGHFLGDEHTRRHYLSEHYMPTLSNRTARTEWEKVGSRDIVSAAREKAERILREHSVEPLDRDVDKEFDTILAEADKELTRSRLA